MTYKHWCGCKTEKINGVIHFKKMCKLHQKNGYPWIALQHEEEENNEKET